MGASRLPRSVTCSAGRMPPSPAGSTFSTVASLDSARPPLAGASRFIADVLLRPINEMLIKTVNHEAGTRQVRIEAVKRLLIVSAFLVVLSGCGLGEGRDVRAYNTCLARHPEDVVVCEGPRQAYEVDPTVVHARSARGDPAAGHGYEESGSTPPLASVPFHQSPMTVTPDANE